MSLLRTALANRQLLRLEAGWSVESLGMWAFSILLALYAYYERGAAGVGLAVLVRALPAALLAQFAWAIVDRGSPRMALLGSALARLVLIEAIALVVSVDASFALVLALAAGMEVAGIVNRPARGALVAELAHTPAEVAAVTVGRAVEYTGFLAGALAAGALLSATGLHPAFAYMGLAFAALAGLAWRLPSGTRARRQQATAAPHPRRAAGWRPSFAPLARAIRAVGAQRWTRVRVGLFGASTLARSMLEVLLVVAALDLLSMGAAGVGWLRAAFAAGALLGGAAAVTLLRRGRLAVGLAGGMGLAGLPLALVAAWPAAAPALLLLVLLGGGYAVMETALGALTHHAASTETLARTAHAEELVHPLARALGVALAAVLVVELGGKAALIVAGLLLPVVAALSIRALTNAERGTSVPPKALRLLSGQAFLAELPSATLESLARCATPHRFAPGDTILRQGHGTNCFHVIESGTVERREDGQSPVRLGEADSFGREALLRDGPPNSTAIAITPVSTLALPRADFASRVGLPVHSHDPGTVAPQPKLRPTAAVTS